MRNFLKTTLLLALFALATAHTSSVFAQRSTCGLRIYVTEANEFETDAIKPVMDARIVAAKVGSRRKIPAITSDGQQQFTRLAEGEHIIIITKKGFKRTVQPVNFICYTPNQDGVIYVELERGSSTQSRLNEKITVRTGIVIGSRDVYTVVGEPTESDTKISPKNDKPASTPKVITGGVLNGKAISKPAPPYPAIAKAAKASGTVTVQITVDEEGKVIEAEAVSGHPLLRASAVVAARQARFSPTLLGGQPVRVAGVITYNFILN
jgi:TonB family C-terminal domain